MSRTTPPLLILLPLMAFFLLACDPSGVTGSEEPGCDADLLTGFFSHDNMEDLSRCLQGGPPITGEVGTSS
jgi:hypothetical protein